MELRFNSVYTIKTLNKIIEDIRLKQSEIQQVANSKDVLLSTITSKSRNNELPVPLETFLTGSYKRGTKITPLDDVDIFYVIGKVLNTSPHHHSLSECSFYFGSDYLDQNGNISSIRVLELIKRELKKTYSSSEIVRNGESVSVFLSTYGVTFDVVPAFFDQRNNYYLIPNGGNSTQWKYSNPKIDEDNLSFIQTRHFNNIKDAIRITKYWFRKKKIKNLRSYHLETIFFHIFSIADPTSSLSTVLIIFFHIIQNHQYLYVCPDATKLSDNLISSHSVDDVILISYEAKKAYDSLLKGEEEFHEYL